MGNQGADSNESLICKVLPGGLPQQADVAQQFEDAADQHRAARPGDPGRQDTHFRSRENEVRNAADEESQENEGQTGAPGAACFSAH